MVAAGNQKGHSVLSDNTDVFVLLLYYSLAQKRKPPDIMESRKTAPQLASISATTEKFTEDIKQTPHEAYIWKHTQDSDPPDMSPTIFGWLLEKMSQSHSPVTVPRGIGLVLEDILQPMTV